MASPMRVAIAAVVTIALGWPRLVWAGCGGGFSGLGSLFSGLGNLGGGGGDGDLPPVHVEIGAVTRRVDGDIAHSGQLDHETGVFSYRAESSPAAATAVGLTLTATSAGWAYYGVDFEFGGIVTDPAIDVAIERASMEAPSPTVKGKRGGYASGGAVAGLRHRIGRLRGAAEVVAGYRGVDVVVKSTYGACQLTEHHWVDELFLEPRLRLDAQLSGRFALAAFAGSNLHGNIDVVGLTLAIDTAP